MVLNHMADYLTWYNSNCNYDLQNSMRQKKQHMSTIQPLSQSLGPRLFTTMVLLPLLLYLHSVLHYRYVSSTTGFGLLCNTHAVLTITK